MRIFPYSKIITTKVSKVDLSETLSCFSECIEFGEKMRVCVTPVNCIIWAWQNKYLENIYNSANLCLADGVPVVWASKFLNNPIKGRVTGLDLLPEFTKIAEERDYSFFFLGARQGVAKDLTHVIKERHPNIRISGSYSPPMSDKFSEEENQKMISMINKVKPNVLWVSLTAPKQDYWIYEHFDKLDVNIVIGVGGAFDVEAGLIKRAPKWMQKNGLEWLFRFLQEPSRMFKRYFIEAPVFVPLVLIQKIKTCIQ